MMNPIRYLTTTGAAGGGALTAADTNATTQKPASTSFVSFGFARVVEICFDLTFGGTVAPTSAQITVWRRTDGRIDRMGSFTVSAADAFAPVPQLFDFCGDSAYATLDAINGGTAPTVTGTIWARQVRQLL